MLILNYTCKLRSVCSCWLDSWATVWISESLSFCFNFSKTGYDEWLSQYLVWTYEWLNNMDEFGEVKGTNTLLHFFPVYEKTLETDNEKENYSITTHTYAVTQCMGFFLNL